MEYKQEVAQPHSYCMQIIEIVHDIHGVPPSKVRHSAQLSMCNGLICAHVLFIILSPLVKDTEYRILGSTLGFKGHPVLV